MLAAWQSGDDVTIYSLNDEDQKTIRFVEVSHDFGENTTLRPFGTGASHDFPFRSEIILVSRGDWERVEQGIMNLPSGWARERLTKIFSSDEMKVVREYVVIDDKLRMILFGLECALNVEFNVSEIERIFTDAIDNGCAEFQYVLYDRPDLHVECRVEAYEPETVVLIVTSKKPIVPPLAAIIERAGHQIYRFERIKG